jgi:hypothetical protein
LLCLSAAIALIAISGRGRERGREGFRPV